MKSTHRILPFLLAVLALPMAAVGQDDEPIDDIVVVGEKSMADLRREVFQAEEDFYSLYNKLNDDEEYDVSCFYETPTGTRIKNHVCRAKFISNAYSSSSGRNRNDISRVASQDVNPVVAEKTIKYQEKLETLIDANPELQAALVRYNTARARFLAEREGSANN